jgi:hypothetical protein
MSAPTTNAAIRAWRVSIPLGRPAGGRSEDGLVVDLGPGSTAVVSDLAAELPEGPWRALHDFVLIDTQGHLKTNFTVMTWSIEEELGCSVFAVIDGALRKFTLQMYYAEPFRVQREETTVLGDLRAVADDDHGTRNVLSNALNFYNRSLAEASRQRTCDADSRIAAIPGAREPYGISADFQRAQEVLCSRVGTYDDKIETELLRVLVWFGTLHREVRKLSCSDSAALVALATALGAFVTGCRLAAFDRTLVKGGPPSQVQSDRGTFKKLPTNCQAEIRGLAKALDALELDLLRAAENQDWNDARINAVEMRAAAAHMRHGRDCLEHGGISVATSS